MREARLTSAVVVATIAFVAYTRTLLPGVDLGDTGGFQAAVLWPEISARQAYPLYFGLAAPFVDAISPGNPARGLNLFSAVWASVAVGLLTWLASAVARSLASGAIAGLLLAFSYTFWTQSVIAEVYTLHLALIGAALVALYAYAASPTTGRFACACAVYAIAFGNHLSTILLLPTFAAFVVLTHPRPRELFRPRTIGLAAAIAAIGSISYLPNLLAIWSSIEAPAAITSRLATFWFEVTKADWRESMLLGVTPATDRLAMWWWDARQQFGVPGIAAAVAGLVRLWWISRPWTVLLAGAYVVCTAFALTYNVGDTHVFFLAGHYFTAFAAGIAFASPSSSATTVPAAGGYWRLVTTAAVVMLAYSAWRGVDTWPATDRHLDTRGSALTTRLTAGISDRDALLVSDMNWDVENALLYAGRHDRYEVVWLRLSEVLPHLPFLVRDNHSIGRDIVLTEDAAADVVAAYGDALPVLRDELPAVPALADTAMALPRGTPYVLTYLEPLREYRYDAADVNAALAILTGGPRAPGESRYQVIAGRAGEPPTYTRESDHPFRDVHAVDGQVLSIRMDAWLPTDTFRRGGFGHVIRDGRPVLFIERGISLLTLGRDGEPDVTYAAGPYAPRPRYRIPAGGTRLARSANVEAVRRLVRTAPTAPDSDHASPAARTR